MGIIANSAVELLFSEVGLLGYESKYLGNSALNVCGSRGDNRALVAIPGGYREGEWHIVPRHSA